MKRTQRGFAIYTEFTDLYKNKVRVQKSSLATKEAVWIFCDRGPLIGDGVAVSPHLSKEMAERVIRALQAFVDGKE
jgi:hypothetical protein